MRIIEFSEDSDIKFHKRQVKNTKGNKVVSNYIL